MINLFYEEPNPDRWVPFDRYPRGFIRRIVRGEPPIGGVQRWYLNLKKGLELIGADFKDLSYTNPQKNKHSTSCIIGKPHVIQKCNHTQPIILGPGLPSHPYDFKDWEKYNIKKILISCDWFKQMYDEYLPVKIPTIVWPSGIDTHLWSPTQTIKNKIIVYDKVRWERNRYLPNLIYPILESLKNKGEEIIYFKYGSYKEEDYLAALKEAKAMIFLCEHETQGFAYLQALSCNVPIYAWNRKGFWQDPTLYPHSVKFKNVSSIPYWDERCGIEFEDFDTYQHKQNDFWLKLNSKFFNPREYILENLTLEKCAQKYVDIVNSIY